MNRNGGTYQPEREAAEEADVRAEHGAGPRQSQARLRVNVLRSGSSGQRVEGAQCAEGP